MEGDDGEPSARHQHPLGTGQTAIQFSEFVVDRDAQRLKGTGGGVEPGLARRDRRAHDSRKLAGAADRAFLPSSDDRPGNADTVATNVGRALAKVPGRDAITFQQLVQDSLPWITDLDLKTRQARPMVQAPKGADYHTWAPNGALLTAVDSRLFRYTDDGWAPVADFAKFGVKNISRIAVSPRGNWLAFVAEDKSSP